MLHTWAHWFFQTVDAGNWLLNNLAHYYAFENNSNDSEGSNNGTDNNITYLTSWSQKLGTYCAGFNPADNSQITIANTTMSLYTAGTVATWIYRDVTDAQHCIIDKTQTWLSNYIQFIVEWWGANTNKLRVIINDWWSVYSTGTIPATTWTHVWFTFDWTDVKFYINWSLDRTVAYAQTVPSTNRNTIIGRVDNGTAEMDWRLDWLWIWSTDKDADAFTSLYNSWSGIEYEDFTT